MRTSIGTGNPELLLHTEALFPHPTASPSCALTTHVFSQSFALMSVALSFLHPAVHALRVSIAGADAAGAPLTGAQTSEALTGGSGTGSQYASEQPSPVNQPYAAGNLPGQVGFTKAGNAEQSDDSQALQLVTAQHLQGNTMQANGGEL